MVVVSKSAFRFAMISAVVTDELPSGEAVDEGVDAPVLFWFNSWILEGDRVV
jgi:hypothetical protein